MSEAPKLAIKEVYLSERAVKLRLPFQFGSTEVRETAEKYCEIVAEIGGKRVQGFSAQLMVPRWFDKRAGLTNEDTIDALRQTVVAAVNVATGAGQSGSVASLSSTIRAAAPKLMSADMPKLAAGFGPALLEMALIDALCRHTGLPFWKAAAEDIFGFGAHLPADLSSQDFAAVRATIKAPSTIALRHTIGFDAPLVEKPADAPADGQPVTLAEVIARTGIKAWKIKLKGDPEADSARLLALQTVLAGHMDGGITLDANEQYTPDSFRLLLRRVAAPDLAELAGRIRFYEQPFAREIALQTPADFGVPIVIDESDDSLDAFAHALALGWAGTSIKSCKGVLRALINMARAKANGALISGEDLTCQPGLCWTQDTAMAAACGVQDIERNGHHFAGGMQGASNAERVATLSAHPDIFLQDNNGIGLDIQNGRVAISSLNQPGFGSSGALMKQTN
ncbi:MAG: enolase C-terminal domain-like protein [Paracoccaceae bacterium]